MNGPLTIALACSSYQRNFALKHSHCHSCPKATPASGEDLHLPLPSKHMGWRTMVACGSCWSLALGSAWGGNHHCGQGCLLIVSITSTPRRNVIFRWCLDMSGWVEKASLCSNANHWCSSGLGDLTCPGVFHQTVTQMACARWEVVLHSRQWNQSGRLPKKKPHWHNAPVPQHPCSASIPCPAALRRHQAKASVGWRGPRGTFTCQDAVSPCRFPDESPWS